VLPAVSYTSDRLKWYSQYCPLCHSCFWPMTLACRYSLSISRRPISLQHLIILGLPKPQVLASTMLNNFIMIKVCFFVVRDTNLRHCNIVFSTIPESYSLFFRTYIFMLLSLTSCLQLYHLAVCLLSLLVNFQLFSQQFSSGTSSSL
jgi:hypothetical protein